MLAGREPPREGAWLVGCPAPASVGGWCTHRDARHWLKTSSETCTLLVTVSSGPTCMATRDDTDGLLPAERFGYALWIGRTLQLRPRLIQR